MGSKISVGLMVVCLFGPATQAWAQLDSNALRAKFGAPRSREVYAIPAGFDLIADYENSQVCRLEVPGFMPAKGRFFASDEQHQRMLDFLAELVPPAIRGKELRRTMLALGGVTFSTTEYERVSIREKRLAVPLNQNDTIAVNFKSPDCATASAGSVR